MDDRLGGDLLSNLKALVKQTARIADALEAANAADPLVMIQGALDAEGHATGEQDDPAAIMAAYVESLR